MDPVRDLELYQGLESARGATVAAASECVSQQIQAAEVDRARLHVEFETLRWAIVTRHHEAIATSRKADVSAAISAQGRRLGFAVIGTFLSTYLLIFALWRLNG